MSVPINVEVLDNPGMFESQLSFQLTCECIAPGVKEEVEWKLVYIGSSEDEKYDQVLDSILVGPVPIGTSKFVFSAPPPDPKRIPMNDILGATAMLLIGLYKDREFIRIGYYVNNDYGSNEDLVANPPPVPQISAIVRSILADKPTVTRFDIPWDDASYEQRLLEEQQALAARELAEAGVDENENDDMEESEEDEEGESGEGSEEELDEEMHISNSDNLQPIS